MDQPKFLVTDESARLARWIRLMGFDAALMPAQPLAALYRRAVNEQRVVVTRNGRVKPGTLVRAIVLARQDLAEQLRQLVRELRLPIEEAWMFSRCDRCNCEVEPVEKAQVKDRVPPYVFQTQERFHRCPSCGRIYWAATHWQRAQRFFAQVRKEAGHAEQGLQ